MRPADMKTEHACFLFLVVEKPFPFSKCELLFALIKLNLLGLPML